MFAKRLAAITLAAGALLAPAASAVEPFLVNVDQTSTLKLSGAASSVILGNATVVDVTLADAHTLLLTGKAYGSTNLIVLDAAGRTLYQNNIAVAGSSVGELTIVRGGGTFSYSCIDKCRPTPVVGDAPDHFTGVMATVTGKTGPAKGE